MKNNKVLFLCATHGDEGFSIPVVKKLVKEFNFDWEIGNTKAQSKNLRFMEADLNRAGPGNINSKIYEERRSCELIKLGNKYNETIDLHGTISKTGIFIIVPNPCWENIELAKKFNIKNVVLWPGLKPTGPLTQFIPNSLEIECGPKNDSRTAVKLERILYEYLSGSIPKIKQNYFIVNGVFTKDIKKPMKDFIKFTYKNIAFYPLMVNQYPKIKCYMMQKLQDKL
jgi:hypothetical protein